MGGIMKLYHGGSSKRPKVATQKELGIHCSPNVLEADVHVVTYITACEADVSSAILVDDMNVWCSLEAFQQILKCAEIDDYIQIAADIWRSSECVQNTPEASAVIRETLLSYNISCIEYIDEHEIPGTECYILLEDQPFTVVSELSEAYPNCDMANAYLPEDHQIKMFNLKPHYEATGFLWKVPKELYVQSPEKIASAVSAMAESNQSDEEIADQQAAALIELLNQDYSYPIDSLHGSVLLKVSNGGWLDNQNPRVSFKGKITSIDKRYNRIQVPLRCDVATVYQSKIKPFIEESLR